MITTDRGALLALLLAVTASAPSIASAGEGDRAEALFQRARTLMEKNDFATACPMLEEAYALDHGEGTLLAMALCHENNGKPATALREYRESLALAVHANRSDRVMLAESHVQRLEARVPRIALRLPSSIPAGLSLTLDGAPADRATMLAGAPVDPGRHDIAAATPGHAAWRTEVEVTATSGSVVVDVPAFASEASPVVAPSHAPSPAPARSSGARILGFTLGGLGVASLGVGTSFGIAAFTAEAKSRDRCQGNACTPDGVSFNHEARQDALVADVTIGAGAVVAATGLFFLLRSPSSASAARPPVVHVWAGERRAGFGLVTAW
jgi:hypothetical protein